MTKVSTLFALSASVEELGKEVKQQCINEILTIQKLKKRLNIFFDLAGKMPAATRALVSFLIREDLRNITPQNFKLAEDRAKLYIKGLHEKGYLRTSHGIGGGVFRVKDYSQEELNSFR